MGRKKKVDKEEKKGKPLVEVLDGVMEDSPSNNVFKKQDGDAELIGENSSGEIQDCVMKTGDAAQENKDTKESQDQVTASIDATLKNQEGKMEKEVLAEWSDTFKSPECKPEELAHVDIDLSVCYNMKGCSYISKDGRKVVGLRKRDGRELFSISFKIGGRVPCHVEKFEETKKSFMKSLYPDLAEFDSLLGKTVKKMQKDMEGKK